MYSTRTTAERQRRSGRKIYYCYQCDRPISISLATSPQVICPICHGGFLLEENPNPNPSPTPAPSPAFLPPPFAIAGFPLVFSPAAAGFYLQQPPPDPYLFRPSSSSSVPVPFNPAFFLHNHLHSLIGGGANIHFVLDGRGGGERRGSDPPVANSRFPGSFGDYYLGPGLEQLIQQLAENDPNRHGTPPASRAAVALLPTVKVSEQLLGSDSGQCAVCMDAFELGGDVKQMPCRHIYHRDCLLPWLALHNSCPVCRYELPTDDPDYERRARVARPPPLPPPNQGPANAHLGSGSGSGVGWGHSAEVRATERSVRISLPWPFRGSQSSEETRIDSSRNGAHGNLNSGGRGCNQDLNQEPWDGD